MDKDNIQLLILTIFGISGFLLFVILVVFFIDSHDDEQGNDQKKDADAIIVEAFVEGKLYTLEEEPGVIKSPFKLVKEISFQSLIAATRSFSELNLLQRGHSGNLYLGELEASKELIVVKKFDYSKTDVDYYEAELEIYERVADRRRFLVPLLGFCSEGEEKLLVYKHMFNGDLATALAKEPRSSVEVANEACGPVLPWITRLKIATGVAEALVFLHHVSRPGIAHRDVKSSSIFLTRNFHIKLGSLSEAQTLEEDGVPVYDVYCFGKVLLDLISGLNVSGCTNSSAQSWMSKSLPLICLETKDLFLQLADPSMILDEDLAEEVFGVAVLAKACMDAEILQNLSMIKVLNFLRNPRLPCC